MQPSPRHVAARFLAQARDLNLAEWGLDGLTKGQRVTLYHGTTRSFRAFDMQKSRTELVNRFYGAGIFLTPSKRVASDYADANRNIGFDSSLLDDLKRKNPKAAAFMRQLYERGNDAWDLWTPETLGVQREQFGDAMTRLAGGVDPNTLADVCRFVIGSKLTEEPRDDGFVNIFSQSTGMPAWAYDQLDEIGLDSNRYRPKIYTVSVVAKNTLVTASKSQAKSAKSKGYDCVVFYGADLVQGVPEVAVFDAHAVTITHVEVV